MTIQSDNALSPSVQWQTLVNASILGADRAGVAAVGDGAWSIRSGGADVGGAAEQLLRDAAALGIYELAGREPALLDDAPAAAPEVPDDAGCSLESGRHLRAILSGDRSALLPEWCEAAAAGRWLAPAETLPALLRAAISTDDAVLRDRLVAVAGARGRWLAEQHHDWRRLFREATTADDGASRWETGTKAERLTALREVRQSDPAAARAMLDAAWSSDSADDRATFVGVLSNQLSADDEPWLEAKLDDRSKQVQAVAADLLSRIDGSALSQRMAERARAHVRLKRTGLLKKKLELDVTLPESIDAQMKRDSLEVRAHGGMGQKAAQLSRLVSLTPLSAWDGDAEPSAWIDAAMAGEWAMPLVDGWKAAAVAQGNAVWAETLLRQVCMTKAGNKSAVGDMWRYESVTPLAACLQAPKVEAIAIEALAGRTVTATMPAIDSLIRVCPGPWSESLSTAVIKHVGQRLEDRNVVYDQSLRVLMTDVISLRLMPQLADQLAKAWPAQAGHWSANFETAVTDVAVTVRFRRSMLAALARSQSQ